MSFYVRIIDDQGLFIEDAFVNELTQYTIQTECPPGLFRPKWNGSEWVEGGVPPEQTSMPPTLVQRVALLEQLELDRLLGGG